MLWTPTQQFHPWPFDKEAELETTIAEVKTALFGESRIYLDVKKLIAALPPLHIKAAPFLL